jgi:hypothetical protein
MRVPFPTTHQVFRPTPGDALLNPVVVVALVTLVANDHVGKALAHHTAWSVVTGKLSDVAGLLFLPVLVLSGCEVLAALRGRFGGPSVSFAVIVAVGVALAFGVMKTWEPAAEVYRHGLGLVQWPARALLALLVSSPPPGPSPVQHVMDETDLIALPATAWAVLQARSRARSWANSAATIAENEG